MMSTNTIKNSSTERIDGIVRSVRVLVVDNDIVHARTMGGAGPPRPGRRRDRGRRGGWARHAAARGDAELRDVLLLERRRPLQPRAQARRGRDVGREPDAKVGVGHDAGGFAGLEPLRIRRLRAQLRRRVARLGSGGRRAAGGLPAPRAAAARRRRDAWQSDVERGRRGGEPGGGKSRARHVERAHHRAGIQAGHGPTNSRDLTAAKSVSSTPLPRREERTAPRTPQLAR